MQTCGSGDGMKKSEFRTWVQSIWREHCEECREWKDVPLPMETYLTKYKWWLKREFRYRNSVK